jgi:hypothetical protein
MVTLVVLDEEVAIADHGQNDLGHPAVEGFLLVSQFSAKPLTMPKDKASATTSHQAIGWVATHHAETMSEA